MREVFIGPWRYWLIWMGVVAALYLLGANRMHVLQFVPFTFVLLAIAAAVVGFVLATHRPGERVTREPFEELLSDE